MTPVTLHAAPREHGDARACHSRAAAFIIALYLAPWCSWLTRRPLKAESASSSLAGAITHPNKNSMRDSNARKSAFLGMPHGTASGRLRKIILFHLLQKHDENVCFRCSRRIETADELSIEHKQPWEGISVELFGRLITSHSHTASATSRTATGVTLCGGARSALKGRLGAEGVKPSCQSRSSVATPRVGTGYNLGVTAATSGEENKPESHPQGLSKRIEAAGTFRWPLRFCM